jgi:hypothetical protein
MLFSSYAQQLIKHSSYMLNQTSVFIFLAYNQAHSRLFKYTNVPYKRSRGKNLLFFLSALLQKFFQFAQQDFVGSYVSSRNIKLASLPTYSKVLAPETMHFITSVMNCFAVRMHPTQPLAVIVTVPRLMLMLLKL